MDSMVLASVRTEEVLIIRLPITSITWRACLNRENLVQVDQWACIVGIVLLMLIGVEKCSPCMGTSSWVWVLDSMRV